MACVERDHVARSCDNRGAELNKWRAAGSASTRPAALDAPCERGRPMTDTMPPQSGGEKRPDGPTSVYLYRDQWDLMLYVGVTSRGIKRNREHNQTKEWWPWVATQSVEHFATRAEALAYETEMIRRYRPPFNTQHNPDHHITRTAYIAFRNLPNPGQLGPRPRWVNAVRMGDTIFRTAEPFDGSMPIVLGEERPKVYNERGGKGGILVRAFRLGPHLAVETSRKWDCDTARIKLRWCTKPRAAHVVSLMMTELQQAA